MDSMLQHNHVLFLFDGSQHVLINCLIAAGVDLVLIDVKDGLGSTRVEGRRKVGGEHLTTI